jgi:single-strand DNA-binding protein
MSKGTVNKVILIGRLGADPEIRATPSGMSVGNINVATNRVYKDRNGQMQDETTWHRVVLWGKTADLAKEYLQKGARVYIEGRIQNRSWDDQSGQKRYTTEIVCEQLQFLDTRAESNNEPSNITSPSIDVETPPDAPEDDVPF